MQKMVATDNNYIINYDLYSTCVESGVVTCVKISCRKFIQPHHKYGESGYLLFFPAEKECVVNGVSYKVGEYFKDECNKWYSERK